MDESRPKAAPNDSGNEVSDEPSATGEQGAGALTAKQRKRYSSVTMEGKLAVRGPGYEAFDLATTIGKMMAPGGTFRMLLPGEAAIGVVVRLSHRDRVLELAGITTRAWRSHVWKWEHVRMAHRCAGSGRGDVTLFFHPQMRCPVPDCVAALPPERKERSASERKQRSVQVEAAFRIGGSSVPRDVLNTGESTRDEQGDASVRMQPLDVASVQRQPQESRSEVAARIRRERDLGLADRDIAALLNQSEAFTPPDGFVCWTGYAVRVSIGEATYAA